MAHFGSTEFGDLGDPVIGDDGTHPWIRCIGDEIVRYVRPSIEDPAIKALRETGRVGELILPRALGRLANKLERELDVLQDCGVAVAASTIEVCEIPVFNLQGKPIDKHLGLQIKADIVDGTSIVHYFPETDDERYSAMEAVNKSFNGLERYIQHRLNAGEAPLADIYGEFQYLLETSPEGGARLVLVDTDPIFVPPTPKQALWLLDHAIATRFSLLNQLENNPSPAS